MREAADLFGRVVDVSANWLEVHKGTKRLIELADRHYTRQTKGSNQAFRPGYNMPLLLSDGSAAWNVWRPDPEVGRKDHLEAWECTLFRNEGPRLSSDLVREATRLTFGRWGWPPKDGLISAIGIKPTKHRRSKRKLPGVCFRAVGWVEFEHPFPDPEKVWLRAPHPRPVPRSTP